jgi:F-type H+-transporting ATPase subunit alpha
LHFSHSSIIDVGPRIALRGKVNETLLTGLRIVDTLLPIGRGQRQLILGDRNTGKTSIGLSTLITNNKNNYLGSIDGFGSKRLFGIYMGINQNLSKLYKLTTIFKNTFYNSTTTTLTHIFGTHTSSSAMITLTLPILGTTLGEILRDRGFDVLICFDDLTKHAKSYRQISLILGKVPSRDAFPADIFNIHSSILERCGRLNNNYRGSISSLPIIETVNSDITEFIATNVISITDGQVYTNRGLFNLGIRPAIDTGLSVSRIGSSAQCMYLRTMTTGIRDEMLI